MPRGWLGQNEITKDAKGAKMGETMKANFGQTAKDYRKYRAGFPRSFFQTLKEKNLIEGSETVIDLGTGTGTVARGLASLGCEVTGIDPAEALLVQAKEIAEAEGLKIHWHKGNAEKLDVSDNSIDVVAAGQCWHWFEPNAAIEEIRRVLKPNGLLIICHFDWLPFGGNVVEKTEALIREMNPHWQMDGGVGVYPEWFRHLSSGSFTGIESYSYDESVSYSREAWRGRIRASAGVSGSLSEAEVAAFDQRHEEMLEQKFPIDPLRIPHRVFVVYGRKPSQAVSGGNG